MQQNNLSTKDKWNISYIFFALLVILLILLAGLGCQRCPSISQVEKWKTKGCINFDTFSRICYI